ncbi:MAG: UPF0182 family protein [Labilithrix sp.]|nr:UPF0182 family protein [Labilithrix sp.]
MYVVLLLGLLAVSAVLVVRGHMRGRPRMLAAGAAVMLGTIGFFGLMSLWGEMLWFEEVGFVRRFWTSVVARVVVAGAGAAFASGLTWALTLSVNPDERVIRRLGVTLAAVVGALWGLASWTVALRWGFGVRTPVADPIFGKDTGFYLFRLPFYDALFWLFLFASTAALVTAVLAAWPRRVEGAAMRREPSATPLLDVQVVEAEPSGEGPPPEVRPEHELASTLVRRHRALFAPLGALALTLAYGRLLAPYHLMYSRRGAVEGAGWTDVHVLLPVYYVLAALLVAMGIVLLVPAATRAFSRALAKRAERANDSIAALATATVAAPAAIVVAVALLGLGVVPALVQWLVVEPNELSLEERYLRSNIAFTRDGFNLEHAEVEEFPLEAKLTPDVIRDRQSMLENVRLWDPRAFNEVVRQFQELRLYYDITGTDFDRYTVGDEYRQVMLSPREMEASNLPVESQTFVNRHFKYTHGFGLVMAPVSEFTPTGLPELIVRDIPPVADHPSLRIERPEIYFGERTNHYVVANSRAPEFNYPMGGTNVYTHYAGRGGVPLESFWRKLVYGWKLGGTRLLFSDYPTPESRILFHRNIADRVAKAAPFLTLDHDPYPVIVEGRIKWIVDAYTTSDRYPYSEAYAPPSPKPGARRGPKDAATAEPSTSEVTLPTRLAGANYVRNSVKAVVDAYDGSISLYVFEPNDPVVQVWSRIYPDLFRPSDAMPEALRVHVRYPEAMLETQGLVFAKYHMTDPRVFYNREDLWVRATEKYSEHVRPVDPYYVMWQAPGSRSAEFILMQPFTPKGRQVLIGWIAALCDGANYGRLIAYRFPKDQWVLGPQQVDTKIDQSPSLSAQLTLWDQHGKRVIRGNVLAIPIDTTILYVEPIYIQAEAAAYPELRTVVLMHGDEMSYAPTFAEALEGLVTGRPVAAGDRGAMTPSEAATEANRAFDDYVRLMSTGDFAEAGKQLEVLRDALRSLQNGRPLPSR